MRTHTQNSPLCSLDNMKGLACQIVRPYDPTMSRQSECSLSSRRRKALSRKGFTFGWSTNTNVSNFLFRDCSRAFGSNVIQSETRYGGSISSLVADIPFWNVGHRAGCLASFIDTPRNSNVGRFFDLGLPLSDFCRTRIRPQFYPIRSVNFGTVPFHGIGKVGLCFYQPLCRNRHVGAHLNPKSSFLLHCDDRFKCPILQSCPSIGEFLLSLSRRRNQHEDSSQRVASC